MSVGKDFIDVRGGKRGVGLERGSQLTTERSSVRTIRACIGSQR